MGKNHKHQKKLKSEKAKVHIKSKTKFLPKGQNVTNTNFKIKPIIIQEQLKAKDTSLILSKKKQTVKELTTKLKHHNDSVKSESCEELREMIKTHPDLIKNYLSGILQVASTLVQDRERKVRRASVKLITEILKTVPHSNLAPFFYFISTNLRCAMTNIDKNIQEDSLLLLDSVLELVPGLVAQNSDKIFPDFLTLISKFRNENSLERTLTLNLGSKLTAVKWRIKVLSRLYGILDAIVENNKKNCSAVGDNGVVREYKESIWAPIYGDCSLYETCAIDFFNNINNNSNSDNTSNILKTHIVTLVPLLYETWLEVVPEKSLRRNANDITVLNEDAAAILSCIMNILYLLYDYAPSEQINSIFPPKECDKFLAYLLANFPYGRARAQSHTAPGGDLSRDVTKLFVCSDDPRCYHDNLLICHLFLSLKLSQISREFKVNTSLVASYINRCLKVCDFDDRQMALLLRILRELLVDNADFWHKYEFINEEFLGNLIGFYEIAGADFKADILDVLTSTQQFQNCEKYREWLALLPSNLLGRRINAKMVDVIFELSKQGCQPIQLNLHKSLKRILANLETLQIDGASNLNEIMKKIVFSFYYLPRLRPKDVDRLTRFANLNNKYSPLVKDMLGLRFNLVEF